MGSYRHLTTSKASQRYSLRRRLMRHVRYARLIHIRTYRRHSSVRIRENAQTLENRTEECNRIRLTQLKNRA